eukprot:scaffold676768_cov28-Prasinocladus_malaysianus.AAC.1
MVSVAPSALLAVGALFLASGDAFLVACGVLILASSNAARKPDIAPKPVIVFEHCRHGNAGRIVIGKDANIQRDRLNWKKHVRSLSREEFIERYKLKPRTFKKLVDKLKPELETNAQKAINAGSEPIKPVLRVAYTLRFLAGEQH